MATSQRVTLLMTATIAVMLLSACSGPAQQPIAEPTVAPAPTAASEETQAPVAEATATTADAPVPTETAAAISVSFSKDVLPILQSRCLDCHGGRRTEKGFNITSYEHIMAGSEKGPVLVAGDPTGSKLIQLIEQGKMPKRGPKLLPEQLQTLISWIQAGALNN